MNSIPYARQCLDKKDINEVAKVLRSDWITRGPKVREFERALADYCQAKYAVVVSSGTAALHLACLAIGLKKGDEAITTPVTFVATANAILYTGAKPVLADIDYDTVNISPSEILRRITPRTKAILPVHFAGLPVDMEKIYKIAKKHNLAVIEDACHALGAQYKSSGKWIKVGSCRHSHMTVFSFHPAKHITTGEGGAITTNSQRLYEKLVALRNHGIYKNNNTVQEIPWYYEMRYLGFNYHLTDFQAALGISQLKKMESFLKCRNHLIRSYNKEFEGIKGVEIPMCDDNYRHSYHLYVLKIDFDSLGISRQNFMKRLKKAKISTQVHYIPLYRHPYYRDNFSLSPDDFPHSERYYKRALSIPLYPGMSKKDLYLIIKAIKTLLKKKEGVIQRRV